MTPYDAFESGDSSSYARPKKKIWELDVFKEENWPDVATWLLGEKSYLIEENRERFRTIEKNLARYKGMQYESQITGTNNDETNPLKKIVMNHLFDLVQQKVSRLVKYRPAIAILPTANELEDRVGAKTSKLLLDNIWYREDFEDSVQNEFLKAKGLMGECFLAILWDENAGDIHKDIRANLDELKKNKKFVLKNEDGTPQLDDQGNPVEIDRIIHYGDTVYKIWYTLDCLVERKPQWRLADYMFHKEVISKAEAQRKYNLPESDDFTEDGEIYDYEKMETRPVESEMLEWTFYHRKNENFETGCEIKFIGNKIISVKELDSTSGDLPVERMTDVDMPGELHGVSFVQIVEGPMAAFNNLTNMILRNQYLVAHPRWAYPKGSITSKEALGNDITSFSYTGAVPPQLIVSNPTPGEVFSFRATLKEEFQQIAGVSGVSRGEPPPGIKAGIALQFLAEQESERMNEDVLKYNGWIKRVGIKTIERCADNYEPDDERMIMILGRNNKWMSTFFDVKYLSRRYDIRLQNASALPQSKAARTQYLLDLNERFPDKVPAEQVVDMLELAQPEKFLDAATVSVKAAEAENESIMEGTAEFHDPSEYEDHVIHWQMHVKQIREWSFKNQTPKEIQDMLEGHITAHEMLMFQKAGKDPMYQAAIAEKCPGWPLFYVLPEPEPAPPPPLPEEPAPMPEPPGLPQPVERPIAAESGNYAEQPMNVNEPPTDLRGQYGNGAIPNNEMQPPVEPTGQI